MADKITAVPIELAMKQSYIDYAMSVVIGRALPDIRDGLKPVHRRVLFAMNTMGNHYNKPYKKSARIVGDVIGKYHPHGDTAVYDTIVRMAQDFSMRYMLVDGQGNFGSVDGDAPAAMRYTEIRMSKISHELLSDIDKQTVNFRPNYDETEQEPEVLPTRVPNLLVNGSSGIAVGMATNIPPHNLSEVIDSIIYLINENPQATVDDLMKIIPGPDFPTAGIILNNENDENGIKSAYESGKGKVSMQARTDVEVNKKNKKEQIIVTELPYQVNKARLIEKIAELVRDKKIEGISELRDESDKEGMRIVIELKKGENLPVILNNLYTQTQMRTSFSINMVALVEGKPQPVNLKQILNSFISHRIDVVTRRTLFELNKAKEKLHILEGLTIALSSIDKVIKLIKSAENVAEAKNKLMSEKWELGFLKKINKVKSNVKNINSISSDKGQINGKYLMTSVQAQSILDMRLQKLTNLEQEKIFDEYKELINKIDELQNILDSKKLMMSLIVKELKEIKENYGDERRSVFEKFKNFSKSDLTKQEDLVVTLSHVGYVKAQPLSIYQSQKRGGKGKTAATVKSEDFIEKLLVVNSHDSIMCFSNYGKVYWLNVYDIPQSGRTAKGKAIINLLNLRDNEKISAVLKVGEYSEDMFVIMATSNGIIKKTKLSNFSKPRPSGLIAINLKDGDNLIGVNVTDGKKIIMLFSSSGKAIMFDENKVTCVGRNASGVKGISLNKDFKVVSMIITSHDCKDSILISSENGYGKRTKIDAFSAQGRGGKGVISLKSNDKTGKVIGAVQASEKDDLMLITDHGKLIRTSINSISLLGRNTQGVRLIKLDNGEKLSQIEKVEEQ